MKRSGTLTPARTVSLACMLCLATAALAEPSADQVLTDFGLSADDKQRVMHGEYVSVKLGPVSERDLTFATAFLCTVSPDLLAKEILAGMHFTSDTQVQARGARGSPGSLSDLAALQATADEASALSRAEAGERVNLSTREIGAFRADPGGTVGVIQQQLRRTLFARYQAYRDSGLDGVAPYDRGGGRATNAAADLRMASQAATALRKYMPAFYEVLLGYPKAALAEIQEQFFWVKSNIRGKPTYVLTHILVAGDGAARAVVLREFYVSTGYNAEQAIAGFLPAERGTVVVYTSHAFTDQVTGAGGPLKRSIGSRIMADKLKEMFDAGRRRIER